MQQKIIDRMDQLTDFKIPDVSSLQKITQKYAFLTNEYYVSLIDWNNPDDPIRRLIIPSIKEDMEWTRTNVATEKFPTKIPGLQHKYASTCLLVACAECPGLCRYCYLKNIRSKGEEEILKDVPLAMEYIRRHTEINNIMLTGGDPLTLSTSKLDEILSQLAAIDHIRLIRIGTKMTAMNPYRIIDDPSLTAMIAKYSTAQRRIYIINHFDHPREITPQAIEAVDRLNKAGAILCNQTPLIRGVNDKAEVLADLFKNLTFIGVPPYYVFQCRPAVGNRDYAVPIEEGYDIFEEARSLVWGMGKRARFILSHITGEIEIVGKTAERIYMKYHRAANANNDGRFMVFKSNRQAYWLDDYTEIAHDYPISEPYRIYGPE